MKVILQVVKSAEVVINTEVYNKIEQGYLLYVSFNLDDTIENVEKMANKLAKLRINPDEHGKININGIDAEREILSISQFTLYADSRKGNRPSFTNVMNPGTAKELYEKFNHLLIKHGFIVKPGIFQEHMEVSSINDGPLTFIVET